MTDTNDLEQIEILNFLYKTSFRRPTTQDLELRHPSEETFPFNDFSLGQEILLNKIEKFPVGNSFSTSNLLAATDDSILVNGTNIGGKLGYPETTNENSSTSFRVLNVVNSTSTQIYPNVNFILPPNYNLTSDLTNFGNNYNYPTNELIDGKIIGQLAPGGFIRDIKPNIRHFHRLILSPVDANPNDFSPIDITNPTKSSQTFAFAAFDRDGNNILKNSIPSNLGGVTKLSESPLKVVEHYAVYLGSLRYSIRQFSNIFIRATQNEPSSVENGNWSFDFKSGILLFNDIGTGSLFDEFPPVLSFFKYIGPIGIQNLSSSEGGSITTIKDDNNYTLAASSTQTLDITNEVNLNSGKSALISVIIIETGTVSGVAGGYMGKYVNSVLGSVVFYSVEHEINNSSGDIFKCNFDTETGILNIKNLTNLEKTLHVTIKTFNL